MLYLTIIIIALVLSFYFSGTETAFLSVNKVRVEIWRRRKLAIAKPLLRFIKNPERFLYTTLIGNNLANIAFASFATVYFNEYLKPQVTWLLIVITSLLMGEVIPKSLFRSLADWIIRKVVYPLEFFHYLFYPFTFFIQKISQGLLWLLGQKPQELKKYFSERDIEILLRESHEFMEREKREEGKFIEKVLNFRDLPVSEAMIPRADIVAVPDTISLKELLEIFREDEYSKIPVYKNDIDNIIGVVFLKDLFLHPKSLQEIIHPPMFVPTTKKASELLSEFRENNTTIAIVIDEYGGTAGLVTTEDIIEELFGEIEDEFDEQVKMIRKIDEKTYKVNARIEIEELNSELGLNLPEGNYETLAGFLLSRLGHIPKREEVIEFDSITIVITQATRRKIRWVKIILP